MAEEVLDEMAPSVLLGVVWDAPGPVCFGRDDCHGAAFIQVGAQTVIVEGLIEENRGRESKLDPDAV